MSADLTPEPLPSGSLGPPRRDPPTAVGVETPEPEPAPSARGRESRHVLLPLFRAARRVLRGAARALGRS